MLKLPRRLSAVSLVALTALLTACGNSAADKANASADPALKAVSVASAAAKSAPTLKLSGDKAVKVEKSSGYLLKEGDGPTLTDKSWVLVDWAFYSGATGKLFNEAQSYSEGVPSAMALTSTTAPAWLRAALIGKKVGSQVLIGAKPADYRSLPNMPHLGADDTLLIVIDVRQLLPKAAQGAVVAPKADLPTVKVYTDKPAEFSIPDGNPPTSLEVQLLIKGAGPAVKVGQAVYATYTGVIWKSKKVFDSSFKQNVPVAFPLGSEQMIKGWNKAVEGQTVGSRVLVVIPPAMGYGKAGQPKVGISGTDTLVFVIDILAAN